MSYVSRFVHEDDHFLEVPGCPLRAARAGDATANDDESACARCRYNVCFPKQPLVGCHRRTPASVVDAARSRADTSLVAELAALRAAPTVDGPRWTALGSRWLAAAAPDDDEGRELATTILRFAAATAIADVEILR